MVSVTLSRYLTIPTTEDEFKTDHALAKEERTLRDLLTHNKTFIYRGDTVRITENAPLGKEHPHFDMEGEVFGLVATVQSGFNVEQTQYSIRKGLQFVNVPHFGIELVRQAPANALLERILRQDNEQYANVITGIKTSK